MSSWGHGVEVGIAVTAGLVTAVIRRAKGEAEAVLVDGWPTQSVVARDDDQLTAAVNKVHGAVWSDVDYVVLTYPGSFSSVRMHRLRQAVVEVGWPQVRVVSAPVAVGMAHASSYDGAVAAVADVTGSRCEVTVLEPQPGVAWGHVASQVTGHETQSVTEVVGAAASAAGIPVTGIKRVFVIGEPSSTGEATSRLSGVDISGAVAVSPVELAGDGLVTDDVITGGNPSRELPARGWTWPRPLSSLACAAAATAALGVVMSGAGSIGAQPDTTVFALACLTLFTAVMGGATFAASRPVTHKPGTAGWIRAGRALLIGTGVGIAAVVAAVLVVTLTFAVTPWPLVMAGGFAIAPSVIACVVIAAGIAAHPEPAPRRNLWPPVGAMAAVAAAAIFVHNAELDTTVDSGLELLPARIAAGVWLFAITGLLIPTPWPRVFIGLGVGVVAGFMAAPGTIGVFAVIVIAAISAWWLVIAALTVVDRHGLPSLKPPTLRSGVASTTRTVH